MPLLTLKLFVNVTDKKLMMSASDGSLFTLPTLYQGDTYPMRVQLVERTSGGTLPSYSVISPVGLSLRVGFGVANGTTGTTPAVMQDVWTADTVNNALTANLALNTAAVASLIGTAASVPSTFEIEVLEAGNYYTVFQGPCTVAAEVIESTAVAPSPVTEYYNKNEANATFPKFAGNAAGATITLLSPDGTRQLIIGCNDDGSVKMDTI